jgi:hypothetical protein
MALEASIGGALGPTQGRLNVRSSCPILRACVWLGTVEAPDKQSAIEKVVAEFKVDPWRLYAMERRRSETPPLAWGGRGRLRLWRASEQVWVTGTQLRVEYDDGSTHVILADQLLMPSPLELAAAKSRSLISHPQGAGPPALALRG